MTLTAPFVPPEEIVLLRPLDRRRPVLFSLDVGDGNFRKLLVSLGAIDGLDEHYLQEREADAARRLLQGLNKLDLRRVASQPAARTALVELFQNVLNAIARGAPTRLVPERLLGYAPASTHEPLALTERELRWFAAGEPACIAKDNADREWIRRLFPQEPLITATLGSEVIQRVIALAERRATVAATVRVSGEEQALDADALKRTLEDLLPGLLALAELSRLVTGGLNLHDIAGRWRRLRIRRVENVWFHVELGSGGSVQHGDWLKDSRGDVVAEEETKGEPPKIWLDAPEAPSKQLSLRAFAEPLAITVVGNPVVAGIFALALAEYDGAGSGGDASAARQRFEAYLQKQGAARLANVYGRELKPLSDEERAALFEGIRQTLASLGLVLRDAVKSEVPRVLGLRDLDPDSFMLGDIREEDVRQALSATHYPEKLQPFVPDFACRGENEMSWNAWLSEGRRREQLISLAQHLKAGAGSGQAASTDLAHAAMHEKWEHLLEQEAEHELMCLGFSPRTVAYQWLAQVLESKPPFDEPDLLNHLIVPNRYDTVTTLVETSACTWKTRSIQPASPSGRELTPQTPEQRQAEDLKKGAIGADGEEALLEFVVAKTAAILSKFPDEGWGALERTTREKSVRHQHLRAARGKAPNTELLRKALHVSQYDGAAGFDLLGLELDESGVPRAVCYECKALPNGNAARVHISSNELATMRHLRREPGRGRWKLIGVHTGGKAQDLTHLLDVVHDESSGPIVELARHGLAFDSLILSIHSEMSLPME